MIGSITLMNLIFRIVALNIDVRFAGIRIFSAYLWTAFFLAVTLILVGKIYNQKILISLYLYLIVILAMKFSGHLQFAASVWIESQLLPLCVSAVFFEVFVSDFGAHSKRTILFFCMMIFISLITNIVGLYRYPVAVREIVSGSAGSEVSLQYARMGIDGYGFFSGLPPFIPTLVYMVRKSRNRLVKLVSYVSLVLIFIAIILCTITTPLILAIMGLVLALMIGSAYNRFQAIAVVIIVLALVITMGPTRILRSAIPILISVSPSDDVALRLRDIDYALAGNFEVSESSSDLTSFEARFQRVYWNLDTFFKNPILGSSASNERGAFHLFWLYTLATIGLVGFVPLIIFVYSSIRRVTKMLDKETAAYYLLSFLLFVSMGIFKNSTGWFMYLGPFFLIPGLFVWQNSLSRIIVKC